MKKATVSGNRTWPPISIIAAQPPKEPEPQLPAAELAKNESLKEKAFLGVLSPKNKKGSLKGVKLKNKNNPKRATAPEIFGMKNGEKNPFPFSVFLLFLKEK